jgi:hypothetical protein
MFVHGRPPGYPLATLAVLIGVLSCSTNDAGLGGAGDGSAGRPGDLPTCLEGTIDQANWPAGATFASCIEACGPDDLGTRKCGQMDLATCRTMGGCVCLSSPCAICADCLFAAPLPDCYLPLDAESGLACPKTVVRGGPCTPSCGRSLCLQADGKTGCVCNAYGKYACADWGDATWR